MRPPRQVDAPRDQNVRHSVDQNFLDPIRSRQKSGNVNATDAASPSVSVPELFADDEAIGLDRRQALSLGHAPVVHPGGDSLAEGDSVIRQRRFANGTPVAHGEGPSADGVQARVRRMANHHQIIPKDYYLPDVRVVVAPHAASNFSDTRGQLRWERVVVCRRVES